MTVRVYIGLGEVESRGDCQSSFPFLHLPGPFFSQVQCILGGDPWHDHSHTKTTQQRGPEIDAIINLHQIELNSQDNKQCQGADSYPFPSRQYGEAQYGLAMEWNGWMLRQ
ncbi:hypothetical protein SAY87_028306 [Trapa incisa]|uniref:Uncharacterized protein n=1 Tax=Trapa incisa TaxID=236973 RepID=A0AAN7L2D7_9MYRT|nr:hypothetical protein SAY87_028306 [Trapa incisa]